MLLRLFGVFRFDKCLQIGQVHLPEVAIVLEPGIDCTERLGIELVDAVPAFAMLPHQVGPAQQPQVLGDGGARDGKRLRNLSRGLAAATQKIEYGAPRGIGQRLKRGLRRKCNRTVTHNA